jgi:hypothetical protein
MKSRKSLLSLLACSSVLFAGAVFAQNQPMQQPTAQPAPQQSNPPTTSGSGNSVSFNSQQGQVTVNSTVPQVKDTGPAPDFGQLSGGKKFITEDDATAYPPLANDFLHASNGSMRLTKGQYEAWLKHR